MVVRFTRLLPWPLALLVVAGPAAPASAQRAIISAAGPGMAPVTDLIDIPTGAVTRLSNDATDKALFLSDGSVLLRRVSGQLQWRARFMTSGAEIALPAEFLPIHGGPASNGVPHPREPVIFGSYRLPPFFDLAFPARLDAAGLRVFHACEAGERYSSFDLSPDGRELHVLCNASFSPETSAVAIIDSTSGAAIRRVPLGAFASSIVIGPGGAEFLTLQLSAATLTYELVRSDAATGLRLASAALPFYQGIGPWALANPRRRDRPLLVRCVDPGPSCTAHVVDFHSLAIGTEVQARGPLTPVFSFSADGRETVASGVGFVSRIDTTTGATLNFAAAPPNGFIIAAWGAEPQAPLLAPPVVNGGNVTLSWTLPTESTAATGYRLEAGSRPGAADILTQDGGPAPGFGASGVPAGHYYVRVRALNGNGTSLPSNDVTVDVP